jgi:hypothetical protein
MTPLVGHLGPRISALLDGQLSPVDEERAWGHVHACHLCRDQVEREGWVKTRLAAMSFGSSTAPAHLKGSLLVSGWAAGAQATGEELYELSELSTLGETRSGRRGLGITALSGSAVGAAMMGVLALGASPANAPGVIESPVGASVGGSLGSAFTTVVDRTYGPFTPAELGRRAGSGHDTAPLVRALRRTLTP